MSLPDTMTKTIKNTTDTEGNMLAIKIILSFLFLGICGLFSFVTFPVDINTVFVQVR